MQHQARPALLLLLSATILVGIVIGSLSFWPVLAKDFLQQAVQVNGLYFLEFLIAINL